MHIRPFRLDQTNTRLSYLQLGSSRQDIRQVIPSSGRDDLQLDRIGPLLAALSEVLTTGGTAAIRGFHHCSLHRLRAAVKTITDYTYTPRSEFTKFSGHLYDKHCHTLKTLQLTCGTVAWSLIVIMQENKTKGQPHCTYQAGRAVPDRCRGAPHASSGAPPSSGLAGA